MAFSGFRNLRRRSADRVHDGAFDRLRDLGKDGGQAPETCLCAFLAYRRKNRGILYASGKKIFEKNKKIICICEKMGYNMVEWL